MKRPRLVALDVDGTLLGPGRQISPTVRAAVARAAESAHIVIATGRSVLGTLPVLAELGLRDGVAVCSNGAVRVDVATGVASVLAAFDPAPALDALDRLLPGAVYAVEVLGSGHRVSAQFPATLHGDMRVVDRAGLVAEPTTRAIAWCRQANSEHARSVLVGADVPGVTATLDHLNPDQTWLTMVAPGVSKATALAVVCGELGVDPAQVLALGDGSNDTEMLRWAGRGVAMGQAPDEVRAAADDVTATVDDDGAAKELDRWFAGGPTMARVVSYRPRREALTARQRRAWEQCWPRWGADVDRFDHGPGGIGVDDAPPGQVIPSRLDTRAWFGRDAPLVLEIGFGTGTATAAMATREPDVDILGVEVYTPGVAQLFQHCLTADVSWVRALRGDAVTVLRHLLAPGSLAGVRVFFPDPWPKRKHWPRRLLQPATVELIASRLRPGGVLHVATDIATYASQIAATGDAEPTLTRFEGAAPVSLTRPVTKFERRALEAEESVTDLVWGRL